jgi:hypothetical protein
MRDGPWISRVQLLESKGYLQVSSVWGVCWIFRFLSWIFTDKTGIKPLLPLAVITLYERENYRE